MSKRRVKFAKSKSELHDLVRVRKYKDRSGDEFRLGVAQFNNMQEFVSLYESLGDEHWSVQGKRTGDTEDESRERFIFGNKTAYGRSKEVAPLRTIDGVVEMAKKGFCKNVFFLANKCLI